MRKAWYRQSRRTSALLEAHCSQPHRVMAADALSLQGVETGAASHFCWTYKQCVSWQRLGHMSHRQYSVNKNVSIYVAFVFGSPLRFTVFWQCRSLVVQL